MTRVRELDADGMFEFCETYQGYILAKSTDQTERSCPANYGLWDIRPDADVLVASSWTTDLLMEWDKGDWSDTTFIELTADEASQLEMAHLHGVFRQLAERYFT